MTKIHIERQDGDINKLRQRAGMTSGFGWWLSASHLSKKRPHHRRMQGIFQNFLIRIIEFASKYELLAKVPTLVDFRNENISLSGGYWLHQASNPFVTTKLFTGEWQTGGIFSDRQRSLDLCVHAEENENHFYGNILSLGTYVIRTYIKLSRHFVTGRRPHVRYVAFCVESRKSKLITRE